MMSFLRQIKVLAIKECSLWLTSPLSYIFVSVFLGLSGWLFFSEFFLANTASMRQYFNLTPFLFIVFLPAMTMGLFAEEKSTGTFEFLTTLPLTITQIVLAKFLACAIFLVLLLISTLPIACIVAWLGPLDIGVLLTGYSGLLFFGLASMALGLWFSALCKNQIVAYLMTLASLFLLHVVAEPFITQILPHTVADALRFISFNQHVQPFLRGLVDSRDVIFFMACIFLFLRLNIQTLTPSEPV